MWILLMTACTKSTPTPVPTPVDPEHTADTAAPLHTADTGDSLPPICASLPPLPTATPVIQGLGISEDFAFDVEGRLVGVENGNLRAVTRDGDLTLISPNVGDARGNRILLDGSVVVASVFTGTLQQVQLDGARTTLASVPQPNGIAIDPRGDAWVTSSSNGLYRVGVDGSVDLVGQNGSSLDGIVFSPDYRVLYFNSELGNVWRLEIDADGDPVGTPELFADVPLGGGLLDGMTTDICGNLYVIRMDGHVVRFLPDGTLDGIVDIDTGFAFIPALNFGPGIGGFERDHLYVMNFGGGVFDLDIGVEGRWEPHYPVP
ncbi:MAG: SMP-30/gluconolactonase/LRE family protein [Myxococcota bacterium]